MKKHTRCLLTVFTLSVSVLASARADDVVLCVQPAPGAPECYVEVLATTTNTTIRTPFTACGLFISDEMSNAARISFVSAAVSPAGQKLAAGEQRSQCLVSSKVFSVVTAGGTAAIRFIAWRAGQ